MDRLLDEMMETDMAFEDAAQSSDEIVWDKDTEACLEAEWNPGNETDVMWDDPALDFDSTPEDETSADAPVSAATLREQMETVSMERMEAAARKDADFDVIIQEWDRLDRNRERRERYHEIWMPEESLSDSDFYDGKIYPTSLDDPIQKLLIKGKYLDILFDCPYEMYQLTGSEFLSDIVDELKDEHKEILYFLSLRLYSTVRLAKLRGQSDRNIRKVRDTYTRKLQSQLYDHLCKLQEQEKTLTLREREFLELYQDALNEKGKNQARVRRENKYPKRKKAAPGDGKDGG